MSSIVSIIETVVLDLTPKPAFIHGDKAWANLKADEKKYPCVILVEPVYSDDVIRQGGLYESAYPLFMIFVDRTELRFTPEQHRPIVDSMRSLSRQFLLKLKAVKTTSTNEHVFKSIENIKTTDTFNEFDVNTSGVFINFTATPLNSDSVCV